MEETIPKQYQISPVQTSTLPRWFYGYYNLLHILLSPWYANISFTRTMYPQTPCPTPQMSITSSRQSFATSVQCHCPPAGVEASSTPANTPGLLLQRRATLLVLQQVPSGRFACVLPNIPKARVPSSASARHLFHLISFLQFTITLSLLLSLHV